MFVPTTFHAALLMTIISTICGLLRRQHLQGHKKLPLRALLLDYGLGGFSRYRCCLPLRWAVMPCECVPWGISTLPTISICSMCVGRASSSTSQMCCWSLVFEILFFDCISNLNRHCTGGKGVVSATRCSRVACSGRTDGGGCRYSGGHYGALRRCESARFAAWGRCLHHLWPTDGDLRTVHHARHDAWSNPYAYTTAVFLTFGAFICRRFFFNTILMRKPIVGTPVAARDYFRAPASYHALGLLGGAIWELGGIQFRVAALLVGSPSLTPSDRRRPWSNCLWGVFAWKEFRGAISGLRAILLR